MIRIRIIAPLGGLPDGYAAVITLAQCSLNVHEADMRCRTTSVPAVSVSRPRITSPH